MSASTAARPVKRPRRWKSINSVLAYRLARAGLEDGLIARELGVSRQTFWKWRKQYPDFDKALTLAESDRRGMVLADFVWAQLSPELQELWDAIGAFTERAAPASVVEEILANQGRAVRQQLFLHALAVRNFDVAAAMRALNVSRRDLRDWEGDADFGELLAEVDWQRGNFYEDALAVLVKDRNPSAVIFANKTYNRQRGYAPGVDVNVSVSGKVEHRHKHHLGEVLDLDDLTPYLSEGAQRELFQALRRREEERNSPGKRDFTEILSNKLAEPGVAGAYPMVEGPGLSPGP
jgi:transposase-like protein